MSKYKWSDAKREIGTVRRIAVGHESAVTSNKTLISAQEYTNIGSGGGVMVTNVSLEPGTGAIRHANVSSPGRNGLGADPTQQIAYAIRKALVPTTAPGKARTLADMSEAERAEITKQYVKQTRPLYDYVVSYYTGTRKTTEKKSVQVRAPNQKVAEQTARHKVREQDSTARSFHGYQKSTWDKRET